MVKFSKIAAILLFIILIILALIVGIFIYFYFPTSEISIYGLPKFMQVDNLRIVPYNLKLEAVPLNQTSSVDQTTTPTPFQPLPTNTMTSTPTITSTQTATSTFTITLTPTSTETFTPSPTNNYPPDQSLITSIIGFPQLYNLDCEARSAVDFAAYYGINIDEIDFLERLPKTDNPETGFVGIYTDPKGQIPPSSYGVHAQPISNLLNDYGLSTRAEKYYSWEEIKRNIVNGNPVIAWVVNNTYPGVPIEYYTSDGNTITVARYEHTVIVIGYDNYDVSILDGGTIYQRTVDQFLDSWSVLEYMVVVINE